MDEDKKKRLEEVGWTIGDTSDLLDLSEVDWSKYKFISDGTWFDKGTEAEFICPIAEIDNEPIEEKSGLFKGRRKGFMDEEACMFDEFWIYTKDSKLISKPND